MRSTHRVAIAGLAIVAVCTLAVVNESETTTAGAVATITAVLGYVFGRANGERELASAILKEEAANGRAPASTVLDASPKAVSDRVAPAPAPAPSEPEGEPWTWNDPASS